MNYSYKIPCRKEKLRDIRGFVKEVLNKHSISEIDVSTLVLAIDEVCANLIIHGHGCNPKDSIELEIKVAGDLRVEFNIIDSVDMFDISAYKEPKIEDVVRKQRKGGIGLILVKRIMDDIQIIKESKKNICRLTKKVELR
ncbi:ATP-binding protein [Fulvivirga sp. M361]|uniref:ATP-binding protein n=1 Tax=Fulvivirga sp. M361 TaxID=2594266 RepID=UPI00117B34A3|nr:ATP-binding protein [Fulvivirga sp. M361]TRX61250.1 ATP-binding protein [Fulvivirga sp. M361]